MVISDQAKMLRPRKFSVKTILETYEFDLIVFFAEGLSFHSTEKSDSAELRELLKYSAVLQKNTRILYLSPLDTVFESNIDRAIIASANETMCEFYAENYALDVKIIRIPYLYSGTHEKDFLHNVFEQIYNHQMVVISEAASSQMHFLSVNDLSELIVRSVGNWKAGSGILSVGDEFHLTFSDLAKKILELDEDAKIDFTDSDCSGVLKLNNTDLRSQHGWYAKISLVDDLQEQYDRFLAAKQKRNFLGRVKEWVFGHSIIVKTLELFVLFILSEFLVRQTGSAVVFSVVDFRTIFIVIMASLYGSFFGVAAATLSSISYIFARLAVGTNALTLFYEPTNWLTFAAFFLVAGVCGYVHRKHRDNSRDLEDNNALLQDRLRFTSELYEDTLQDKRELKKQINSSKDSFGKILDITQRLNSIAPQLLYLKIVETFEEVLENKSIAIYSVNPNMPYGRLQAASRDLADVTTRSIELAKFAPVIEKIKTGGAWKNTELSLDYPMYAVGIYRDNDLVLMICLWHADAEQRTIYYLNLFRILCDLANIAFMRAYDYHLALFEKKYIPRTHIMNPPYFEECIENYTALLEKKVSSFILLGIDCRGHSLEEVDRMLAPKIRTTDILGITSRGQLQLILTQATLDDLPFILPRYEGLDITFTLDTANTIPVSVVREPEVVSAGKSGIRIAKGILPSAIVALADSVVDTVSGIFTWKKK
jgi:UDP-glucose 4-epimerase